MSCYVTMPNPCHTGVQRTRDPLSPDGPRRENTYGNLGNFGSYAAMRKMYLPEHKHRYIYEARSKGVVVIHFVVNIIITNTAVINSAI